MTDASATRRRLAWTCAVVLLALGAWLRVRDVALPYDRHFEGFSGGAFANAAELHLEHGISELGWFPIFNRPLPADPAAWHFYTNHPATIPLLHYAVTAALGVHEWSLRLPHVLGSLAILGATFALAWAALGRAGALIALAVTAFLPGLVVYSTLPNYENLTLSAMLAMTWAHTRAVQTGARRWWFGLALLTFVGTSLDWPAALLVPGLALAHALVVTPGRARLAAALRSGLFGMLGVVPALLLHQVLVAQTVAITGLAREQIVTQGLAERARTILEPLLALDLGPWLQGQVDHVQALIGPAVALPATLGLLLVATPLATRAARLVVLPGIVAGLGYLVLFARHSIDQDIFWIYALPFVALGHALALGAVAKRWPRVAPWVLVPLVAATAALSWQGAERLRAAWRGDLETERIGRALDAALPAEVSLYVPAEAGWGAAYNYYARRPIHQLTARGVPTAPATLATCVPQAAYRCLDTNAGSLAALDAHLLFLHRSGLWRHPTGLILPAGARHAEQRAAWERARAHLARLTRFESVSLGALGDVLLFPPTDWHGEGQHLAALYQRKDAVEALRARLDEAGRIAGDATHVYLPLEDYGGRGPLVRGTRWYWNTAPNAGDARELLAPAADSTHARDLAFRARHGARGRVLLWPGTDVAELERRLASELAGLERRRDTVGGWTRIELADVP